MKSFRYEWRWRADAMPEQLWPLLADTNRTNRDAGLPIVSEIATVAHVPQTGSPTPLPARMRRLGFTSLGVNVAWDEQPYEWVYPQRFSVLRTYLSGPWDQIIVRGELVPLGSGGTEFIYSLDVLPRGRLGALISAYQLGRISARAFDRTFRNFIALAQQGAYEVASGSAAPTFDTARLHKLEQQLALKTDNKLAQQLCAYIRTSDDGLLTNMRPYEFARHANIARSEALALFFHATSVGLLDLQWDLLCPRCRGAKQTQLSLADVTETVHCDACRIDFTADLPQQIELTFRPNAAVRKIELHEYCVGSPRRTPHIVLQQIVAPGESRDVAITLAPGSYRLRTFATETDGGVPGDIAVDVAHDGDATATFTAANRCWDASTSRINTAATLTLSNNTREWQVLLLERTQWRDDALTAAQATASPLFRDLFASELLRPGESISVGTLTVVFTDLVGSTAFYRQLGDAPAFARVLDHFAVVREAVDAEGGAVVKTMGDAVLAVFQSPAAALRAMRSAQQALAQLHVGEASHGLPTGAHGNAPLLLRVGMHSGYCIAVTLNERLDYFGTTMNLAARLTALSDGSDIVATQPVLEDPEVREMVGARACHVDAELKGLSDVPDLWRI